MRLLALLLGLSLVVSPSQAANVVWRSSSSGVLRLPAPVVPISPDAPAGFGLTFSGATAVPSGGLLDVRPVVAGSSGAIVSYLLFGTLPLGATFDAATGRLGGRPVKSGSYRITISAMDSSGATAAAVVVIVVA